MHLTPKIAIDRIRKRADFLAAARAIRRVGGGVILELGPTPADEVRPGRLRVGFTSSRKIGNAVARNHAKRRLRAAASNLLPLYGRVAHDYVLVARASTLSRPFEALLEDITRAVASAHEKLDRKAEEKS